jgi:hypothetical protein
LLELVVESLSRPVRERGLSADVDTQDLDDVLNGVAQRLLALCEDPFGSVLNLPVILLHGQLDQHRRRPEQFASRLKTPDEFCW